MAYELMDQPDSPEKRAAMRAEYGRARDLAASTRATGRDAATVALHEDRAAGWRDSYMGLHGVPLDSTNPRYAAVLAELDGED